LCTEQEKIKKSRKFCSETAWIRHDDFLPKVREIWEKIVTTRNATDKWYIKLNRVKKFLRGWRINLKGQTKRYKMILQRELNSLGKWKRRTFYQQTCWKGRHLYKQN
jgi:hypothetical protein